MSKSDRRLASTAAAEKLVEAAELDAARQRVVLNRLLLWAGQQGAPVNAGAALSLTQILIEAERAVQGFTEGEG